MYYLYRFRFEIESLPTVILFKSFDEGKNILSKDQFNELALFIKQNSVPLIVNLLILLKY